MYVAYALDKKIYRERFINFLNLCTDNMYSLSSNHHLSSSPSDVSGNLFNIYK